MGSPVVVVDACRSPVGLRHGALSGWHPADLAGTVLEALARRGGIEAATVEEVVLGCSTLVGDQGCNLARSAVLAAGWPESVPATTLDRQGASSLQALAVGAQAVASGWCDVVVAGGVELSTTTPAGAWVESGNRPFGPAVVARYAGDGGLVPPGMATEELARRHGLTRADLDAWAAESRRRARRAVGEGRFAAELVPVAARRWDRERRVVLAGDGAVTADEGLVRETEDAAAFAPMFVPGGVLTAANSAPVGDGAAAVLLMSEARAAELGRRPLAHMVGAVGAGSDPRATFDAVVPATQAALARAGVTLDEVVRFEVDETSAALTLAWMAQLGVDPAVVNPDGGALALGHAPGASGARMLTTLVHGLARTGGGLGLAVLGGVGGVATAVLVDGGKPLRRQGRPTRSGRRAQFT